MDTNNFCRDAQFGRLHRSLHLHEFSVFIQGKIRANLTKNCYYVNEKITTLLNYRIVSKNL